MSISSIQGGDAALAVAKPTATQVPADTSAERAAEAAATGKAYYFSPALVIDPKSGTDVLEYRNSDTGKVVNQYPSEKDLKAYSQHSYKQDQPPAAAVAVADDDAAQASAVQLAVEPQQVVLR